MSWNPKMKKRLHSVTYSLILTSPYHLMLASFFQGPLVLPCSFISHFSVHGLTEGRLEAEKRTSFGMFPLGKYDGQCVFSCSLRSIV